MFCWRNGLLTREYCMCARGRGWEVLVLVLEGAGRKQQLVNTLTLEELVVISPGPPVFWQG